MTIKLNLTVKESTARKAKVYAAKHNTSVSKLVDEYLGKITTKPAKNEFKSFVEKYAGSLKNRNEPIDIDKERDEYLKEKYGI
jgi:predicted HicB family RNase H-like nuclease